MKYHKYFPMMISMVILFNIFLIGYLIYIHIPKNIPTGKQNIPLIVDEINISGNGQVWPPDILNNQYAQPVKDTSYNQIYIPSIYTNIGYVNTSYRQVGVLVPSEHIEHDKHNHNLLILMGRPLYVNRNKWQYYALSNQHNNVKLTVRVKGKPATNEYGVDELYTNNIVLVQGYRPRYRVDLYENDYLAYS